MAVTPDGSSDYVSLLTTDDSADNSEAPLPEVVNRIETKIKKRKNVTPVQKKTKKEKKSKSGLWIEVLVMVIFLYYLDFGLDINMMYNFYERDDMSFLMCNVAGIAVGVLATFGQMLLMVHREEVVVGGWFLLLLGFATPLQVHVIFLGVYSLYMGEKTPLLFAAKLMESVVEATVSSMVQTYAVIFEKLGGSTYFWACASISMSYLSIAYCYASFDRLDTRFLGMPGRAKGFLMFRGEGKMMVPGPLVLVFTARICEVTSRMLSLGLFARAVHDCEGRLFHHEKMAILAVVDGIGNLLMTCYDIRFKEGLWINALQGMFGVFCYVNPVLERRNVASCSYIPYYIWRVLQLGFMFWLGRLCTTWEELWTETQPELYWVLLVTTAGWMILFPIIRCFCTGDGLLEWPTKMFAERRLSEVGQIFRDALLDPKPLQQMNGTIDEQAATRCVEFHMVCQEVLCICVGRLEEQLKVDAVSRCANGHDLQRCVPGKDTEKAVHSCDVCGREGLTSVVFHCHQCDFDKCDLCQAAVEAPCWIPFQALRISGANLVPYMKQMVSVSGCGCFLTKEHSLAQNELYRRVLRALNHAFSKQDVSSSLILITGPHLEELQNLIPPVKEEQPGYAGLQLFTEKCRFVENLITAGFQESSKSFNCKAKEILTAFSIQMKTDIVFVGTVEPEEQKKCLDFMLKEQSRMLVKVYEKTPLNDLKALFGPTKEKTIALLFDEKGEDLAGISAKTGAAATDDLKIRAILDGAQCYKEPTRSIVLETVEHVEALCAVLGNDLCLVLSKKKRAEQELPDLTDKHVESLRELGLRGSDVIEQLVLTKIGADLTLTDSQGSERLAKIGENEFYTNSLKEKMRALLPGTIKVQFSRLVELDPRCLEVEDLKSDKKPWVVNDTALLQLCKAFYMDSGSRSDWLKDSLNGEPFKVLWKDLEVIKSDMEDRAVEQLEASSKEIVAWGSKFVDPVSLENVEMQAFNRSNFDWPKMQAMQKSNYEQMSNLQEIAVNFKQFITGVEGKFAWSGKVRGNAGLVNSRLRSYVEKLGKKTNDYWSELAGVVLGEQHETEVEKLRTKHAGEVGNLRDEVWYLREEMEGKIAKLEEENKSLKMEAKPSNESNKSNKNAAQQ